MAQLVFVHGVATRNTADYQTAVKNRDKLFRELLFTGSNLTIQSPMWGHFVPVIPPGIFDTDNGVKTYSLNIGGTAPAFGGDAAGDSSDISIGAVGKHDPVAALDAICAEIAARAEREKRDLNPEELQAFRKASEIIALNTAATVFDGEVSPKTIADKLRAGAQGSYGITSMIGDAVTAVTNRVRNTVSTIAFGAVRDGLSPAVGRFLGDVFVYLKDGAPRQQIQNEIATALVKAHADGQAGKGPVVVVGHSMGGVILVDMLSNPAAAGLPAGFTVDALLTVGSQPGLFCALDLLAANPPAGSARRKPDCVKHWLNVFDPIDPLAFRTDMIFQNAVDVAFDSVTGITQAHTTYFQRPQFYARSRTRFKQLGIL